MNEQLIEFILTHENEDVEKLILKHKEILGYSTAFVANQINGRRKAKNKLPTWYSNPKIIYPPQQNLEQSSSEAAAEFKVQIIKGEGSGKTVADLTGGYGVDTFFFSKELHSVWYVEPNVELLELARSNHGLLNATNIQHANARAEQFLNTDLKFDWIYLDPSRRSHARKVFKLKDCEPDVVSLFPRAFNKSDNILIKTSPLLDLKEGIRQLPHTLKVYVVSVDNECKEVLFLLNAGFSGEPQIICVNLPNQTQNFEFTFKEEDSTIVEFDNPLQFIYEPNASILKAGAFKTIAGQCGLKKIAPNTHLYTGVWIENFPGRVFRQVDVLRNPKTQIPGGKVNIISRNHPLSPDQIKKKFKLQDGGNRYLLAFAGIKKKYLVLADRLK